MSKCHDDFEVRRQELVKKLSRLDVAVLESICRHADDNGIADSKQDDIAADTRISRRSIQRSIANLRDVGILRIERRNDGPGGGCSNRYRVSFCDESVTIGKAKSFQAQGRMIRTEIGGVTKWAECYSVHDIRANWFTMIGKNSDHGRLWNIVGIKTLASLGSTRSAWVLKEDFDEFLIAHPESCEWTDEFIRQAIQARRVKESSRGSNDKILEEVLENRKLLEGIRDLCERIVEMWK